MVFIQLSYGTIPTFMTFIVPRLSMTSSHKTASIDLHCYQNDVEQFYNFLLRRHYSLLQKFYSMELLLLPTKELVLYLLLKSTLWNLYYWGSSTISCWSLLCGASTTFYWGNSTVFSLTNLNGQEILTAYKEDQTKKNGSTFLFFIPLLECQIGCKIKFYLQPWSI